MALTKKFGWKTPDPGQVPYATTVDSMFRHMEASLLSLMDSTAVRVTHVISWTAQDSWLLQFAAPNQWFPMSIANAGCASGTFTVVRSDTQMAFVLFGDFEQGFPGVGAWSLNNSQVYPVVPAGVNVEVWPQNSPGLVFRVWGNSGVPARHSEIRLDQFPRRWMGQMSLGIGTYGARIAVFYPVPWSGLLSDPNLIPINSSAILAGIRWNPDCHWRLFTEESGV